MKDQICFENRTEDAKFAQDCLPLRYTVDLPHVAVATGPPGGYPPRGPDTLHNNKDDGATVNNWE